MLTIEYASELAPLVDLSIPSDWIVAVVPEPGQALTESDLPEDRLFAEVLSGGDSKRVVATRVVFLYYRGLDPEHDSPSRDNQISVNYQFNDGQYELSSAVESTTVSTVEAAKSWVEEQYLAVETFVDTHQVLIDLAEDTHGLGQTGVRNLVETFETLDEIRQADIEALVAVPYVNDESATALQTALEDVEAVGGDDPTLLERELRTVDEPLIIDLQRGPISGELVPSGASGPTFSPDEFGGHRPDER